MAGCVVNGETLSSQELTTNKSINISEKTEDIKENSNNSKTINSVVYSSNKSNKISVNLRKQENEYIDQNISDLPVKTNYMTLRKLGKTNALGNPLYELRLYADGRLASKFITVSGRASSQNRDRHKSGTKAPLPNGKYSVAKATVPGTHPEVGDRFLPIQPLFRTGRRYLGIHYDPSFEINNGEDGTSGCIALTNREELSKVLNFVRTYRPQFIDVRI